MVYCYNNNMSNELGSFDEKGGWVKVKQLFHRPHEHVYVVCPMNIESWEGERESLFSHHIHPQQINYNKIQNTILSSSLSFT